MNKQRRKRIESILGDITFATNALEEVLGEEQEDFENLPESLQESERGNKMAEAIEVLEDAVGSLQEIEQEVDNMINWKLFVNNQK